jgi:hypothetical protein
MIMVRPFVVIVVVHSTRLDSRYFSFLVLIPCFERASPARPLCFLRKKKGNKQSPLSPTPFFFLCFPCMVDRGVPLMRRYPTQTKINAMLSSSLLAPFLSHLTHSCLVRNSRQTRKENIGHHAHTHTHHVDDRGVGGSPCLLYTISREKCTVAYRRIFLYLWYFFSG